MLHLFSAFQGKNINAAACDLAKEVAAEGGALTLGGVCQTPSYLSGKTKAEVQEEFRKQMDVFVENKLDFVLCEVRTLRSHKPPQKLVRLNIILFVVASISSTLRRWNGQSRLVNKPRSP